MRDHFLTRLYRGAREAKAGAFRETILAALQEEVGFVSAFWGNGRILPERRGVVVNAAQTLNLDPDFLRQWAEVVHDDRATPLALAEYGKLIEIEVLQFYSYSVPCIELATRFDLRYLNLIAAPGLLDGEVQWISLFRSPSAGFFSPGKRRWIEFVFPHICEAWRIHRSIARVPEHPSLASKSPAAIVELASGRVLAAEPGFNDLVKGAWGGFDGFVVPKQVRIKLADGGSFTLARANLSLRAYVIRQLIVLYAETHETPSPITARQFEIAGLYASGMTYKEVATAFGLAPSTVRNHLARVYSALEVTGRRHLAKKLDALEIERPKNRS